jgi:hypothetical protein
MNAETVWNVWRRILREPRISDAIMSDHFGEHVLDTDFTPEEHDVALEYASHSNAVRWFVRGYRFRLTSSVAYALSSCAPLTSRALRQRKWNIRELGERFLGSIGWHDHGPYVYTACGRFLEYLREDLAEQIEGLSDCILVDAASIELVRKLADAPADLWPSTSSRRDMERDLKCWTFRQSGTGRILTTRCAISSWLTPTNGSLSSAPDRTPEHYLIYLPSKAKFPKISLVSPLAKALFEALAPARSLADLQATPEFERAANLTDVLSHLIQLGVLRGAERST